jgi:uncharacterized protein YjiS (DUF1127 family)
MSLTETIALSRRPLPPVSRLLVSATLAVVTWDLRRRTRKDLRALSGHLLLDIGLDPNAARIEAHKPFWRD